MKEATKRSIVRSIHLVMSIPIIGYIYSPFEQLPLYAPRVPVCRRSSNVPFGTLDVERTCRSTTYFEDMDQNYSRENGTRIPGLKIRRIHRKRRPA